MAKERIDVGKGQFKDAELVEVMNANEPWTTYELSDGSVFKVKVVMSEIWRLVGEFDADGNPAYFFKMSPLTNLRSPPELKRKLN